MKNLTRNVASFVCSAALALCVAGCGQPAETNKTTDAEAPVHESQRDETDPTADGRIDVTTTGEQVATFHGAKYIVSDVTVDQESGEGLDEGLGLQEICVVDQPDSWKTIESIGWDRNNLSYVNVAMPWGTVSYRYGYINEASGVEGIEEWSRTNETSYFEGYDSIEHTKVGDHDVAYVADRGTIEGAMGIEDLEAMAEAGADSKSVSVYTYEQRADKCAFVISIACQVNDDSTELSDEDIIADAYAPLEFKEKGSQVDAASFVSDLTLTNADDSASVVIARKGDVLISYTEHMAMLLGESNSEDMIASVTYDFAPEDAPADDVEEHEVDGKAVRVQMGEFTMIAWVDVDGNPLRIEANMLENEDVDATLERVFAGRLV